MIQIKSKRLEAGPITFLFDPQYIWSSLNPEKAFLSPSCSPEVSSNPVVLPSFASKSHNFNVMADLWTDCGLVYDSSFVVDELRGSFVDTANNWSIAWNFVQHRLFAC